MEAQKIVPFQDEALNRSTRELHLDNITLRVKSLTELQEAQLDTYVREAHLRQTIDASKNMDSGVAATLISMAIKQSFHIGMDTDEGSTYYSTNEGMAKLVCEMAKDNHPDLKESEIVDQLRKNPALKAGIVRVWSLQNQGIDLVEEGENNGEGEESLKKED